MSLRFCSLSSGSSGNCIYVESDRSKILIDAGFSGKQVEKLLDSIDVDPSELDAILVTHEHSDHIKGVGVLSRRYRIPVIANEGTWCAMTNKIGKIDEDNILIFKNDLYFGLRDLDILPVTTSHDSAEACGYIIQKGEKKISLLTDTGLYNTEMMDSIRGSDIFFVESNHDIAMLKNGIYPYRLKQRILSSKGHLSNDDCGRLLGDVLQGSGEKVFLAHLSSENNSPRVAFNTVNNYLLSLGLDTERDIDMTVAKRSYASGIIELE